MQIVSVTLCHKREITVIFCATEKKTLEEDTSISEKPLSVIHTFIAVPLQNSRNWMICMNVSMFQYDAYYIAGWRRQ